MFQSVAKTIIIIIDSLGAGSLPDSFDYDDYDVNCLTNISEFIGELSLPYLAQLGFGNITYMKNIQRYHETQAFYGKIKPCSSGKEKLIAYWEIMGVITNMIPTTYTDEIPKDVLHQFSQVSGHNFLDGKFGKSSSVLEQKFDEHKKTKRPIIHASPDGSIQVLAHEEIITPEDLYKICFTLRKICDQHKIMRLIARPCSGKTQPKILFDKEKIFAMPIPYPGMMDILSIQDIDIYSVGRVSDYFNDIGFLDTYRTNNYLESLEQAASLLKKRENNQNSREIILVECNNNYEENNIDKATSYALFLEDIDSYLPIIQKNMHLEDILIIIGDQPADQTKENKIFTREYIPFLFFSKLFKPYDSGNLGIRKTFADIALTLADMYNLKLPHTQGSSFWQKVSSQI